MKNKILMLVTVLFCTFSTFANGIEVPGFVTSEFQKDFAKASNVIWESGKNYYQASFSIDDVKMSAYYNLEGEKIGISRNIVSNQLPLNLQLRLNELKSGYSITEMKEAIMEDETTFYVAMEKAGEQKILKSNSDNTWSVFKKTKTH